MKARLNLILFAAVLFVLPAFAADEPLTIAFDAFRVTTGEDGKESLTPAKTAYPGDTIEYVAVYSNSGNETLNNTQPVIPVPRGMKVDMKTVKPDAADGSIDGVVFSPLPLKESDGKEVSHDQIRALRWHLPRLSPGESEEITFRVEVDS